MATDEDALRDLLAADLAVDLGIVPPEAAAEALVHRWRGDGTDVLSGLGLNAASSQRLREAVERVLRECGGDARRAVLRRNGVARSLHRELSRRGTAADAPVRAPLRRLDPERYAEFAPLGEGGMGTVYLALDTELNRRVAFKVIRPSARGGGDSPLDLPAESGGELEARFLQEAWLASGLEHPGIVPVYEVGRTPGGAPFYTMRLVAGRRTLDDAIGEASTLEQRLALLEPLLKVCDAVAFAHARGVIHRDLKPANVALGAYGEAVVLDWGLAKLKDGPEPGEPRWRERIETLRRDSDLRTLTTALGTPGYMAPEAALGQSSEIDERSDVYSLGAVLYRTLAGRPPYRFASYAELAERLLGEEPDPLPPEVPAGLAAICGRALAREKRRRFDGVGDLAQAIRAWQTESALQREVAALLKEAEGAWGEEPSQLERVAAACRRILKLRPEHGEAQALLVRCHEALDRAIAKREAVARRRVVKRFAVAGLAAATVATVVVALLLDAKRREAEGARAREAAARERSEKERERAEELAGFMLFDLRNGLEPIGRLDLLRQVATRSREYYESLPQGEETPDLLRRRGIALGNVAEVLHAQGDLPGALEGYRAALAFAERLCALHPSDAALEGELAVVHGSIGDVLRDQGEREEALRSYRRSLAIRERLCSADPANPGSQRDLSVSLERIADILRARGDLKAALESYREAQAIRARLCALDPANTDAQRNLSVGCEKIADVLAAQGDSEGAIAGYRESLAIAQRLCELDPLNRKWRRDLSKSHAKIGEALRARGNLGEALRSYREGLTIVQALSLEDPSNADWQFGLAVGHTQVGDALGAQGDLEGALASYRECLKVAKELRERDPSNVPWQRALAIGHNRVGDVARARGDFETALSSYRQGLAVTVAMCSRDASNREWQHDLSVAHGKVGDMLLARGDPDGALRCYRDSLAVAERLSSEDPSSSVWQLDLVVSSDRIGSMLRARGDLAGAHESYRRCVAIARRLCALDPADSRWQRTLSVALEALGDVLGAQGDRKGALASYREDLAIAERLSALDPSNAGWRRDLSVSHERVGDALKALGDLDGALGSYRADLAIVEGLCALDPTNEEWQRDLAGVHERIGELRRAQGDFAAALEAHGTSHSIRERLCAANPSSWERQRDLSVSRCNLAEILEEQGRYRESAAHAREGEAAHGRAVGLAPHLRAEHGEWVRLRDRAVLLAGEREPVSPADHLVLARALRRSKEHARSAEHYGIALEAEEVRADLDGKNLYDAACSAALAAAQGAPWRAKALEWLAEDLRRRREVLAGIESGLLGDVPAGRRADLERARDALQAHIERARSEEPDLASLRGSEEFRALFGG